MKIKQALKWVAIGFPLLLVAGFAFVVGSSYLEHKRLIEQEIEEYPAPGALVDVNNDGNKLHVYAEGEGSETLVFMSGFGTPSPVYDFKALYDELSDDYRVAVVERAGYGWSDITSSPRDIDTVLEETRRALQLAGERPPYVLFPHSMAGLEASYWATLYPEEIEAIIGLDSLVPGYFEQAEEEPSVSPVITFLTRSGLIRNQPGVFENNFHAMKKGRLTEEEAEVARTIFFRRVQTKNMWKEADALPANALTVSDQGTPDIPVHAFISRGNEDEQWAESIISYAQATNGRHFVLDGGHYIHLDYPELIAEKSKEIIAAITDG
jgi:pimeloyl-ACP methyl ester carboxylesterase